MQSSKRIRWTEVIERVLEDSDRPLLPGEIARRAIENAWITSDAADLESTVTGAVSRHIKTAGNKIGFVRIPGPGRQVMIWLSRKGDPPQHLGLELRPTAKPKGKR